ncbi:MAG: hypothetical protein L0Y58_05915, partial [Verrucomicrobia subdivision 3 bacterium]|nr:hypothetical protein [Limisphaerales bacterium]
AALVDAAGNATPVTVSYAVAGTYYTGTGEKTADHILFRGYIHNNNMPMDVTLSGVPAGVYDVIAYSVGFVFNATYEQALTLTGAVVSPTYHIRAQTAPTWLAAPTFVRMSSTDPNARQEGNYVVFEDAGPDASGNLVLNMTPESANTGVNAIPALSGLQLVRVLPVLSIAPGPNAGQATVSWNAAAAGYRLEWSASIGPTANWGAAPGVADPLPGAGSQNITTTGTGRFYRLQQP